MHRCVVEDGNDRKRDDSGGERERARESGMMFGKEGGGQQKSNLQDHIKRYLNLVAPLRASIPRVLQRRTFTPNEDLSSMFALLARLYSLAHGRNPRKDR